MISQSYLQNRNQEKEEDHLGTSDHEKEPEVGGGLIDRKATTKSTRTDTRNLEPKGSLTDDILDKTGC